MNEYTYLLKHPESFFDNKKIGEWGDKILFKE